MPPNQAATTSEDETTTPSSSAAIKKFISKDAQERLVYGDNDVLFGAIESQQGTNKPFGNVLDAGTGLHSLRWIATLNENDRGMTSFTAVTADETMRANVYKEAEALGVADISKIIIGNWFHESNPLTLDENSYDTILADYLIGAMDGFSPYQQDLMIPKLVKYLKPGGRLYIVGLQPLPDSPTLSDDKSSNIMCQVRKVRDACILLAGHRCYREYPVDWIQRQIRQLAPDVKLLQTSTFPILYRYETILKQINVARSKLKYFENDKVAKEMGTYLDVLDAQALEATKKGDGIRRLKLGFDYVVSAEKI